MKKHIDPLSFDILLLTTAIGLALAGGKTGNKNMLYVSLGLFVVFSLYFGYLIKFGKAQIVENKYNGTLSVKPESGTLDTVSGTLKPIDGIKLPNGTVRKFSNGVNVRIDQNGNAKAVNPLSRMLGQKELKAAPDNSWKPLFETK